MAEFWKSNSKHHCKICNVWMADNKMSIASHENGFKHKEKVQAYKKEKRDAKLHGASSERELQGMLADIEKAAKSAIADDRENSSAMFVKNQMYGAPPPPPPLVPVANGTGPRKHNDRPPGGGVYGDGDENREEPPPPVDGMYTVLGQSYLEGSVFQDKIGPNMQCEVFIEDLDDWFVGFISSRTDTPIPNTELFVTSFDTVYALPASVTLPPAAVVLYSPSLSLSGTESISESEQLLNTYTEYKITQDGQHTSADDPAAGTTAVVRNLLERGVKSDRIRLYADSDGNIVRPVDAILEILRAPPAPVIDENTGLGGWQTVAVREYDEKAERELQKNSVEKMFRGEADDIDTTIGGDASGENTKRLKRERADSDGGGGHYVESMDSALSAYNPHKSSTYKGIRLTETADVKEQIDSISGGAPIAFKKRKRPQGGRVLSTKIVKDED